MNNYDKNLEYYLNSMEKFAPDKKELAIKLLTKTRLLKKIYPQKISTRIKFSATSQKISSCLRSLSELGYFKKEKIKDKTFYVKIKNYRDTL